MASVLLRSAAMSAGLATPRAARAAAALAPRSLRARAPPGTLRVYTQAQAGGNGAPKGGESRAVQQAPRRGGEFAARRAPLSQLAPDFSPLYPSRVPSLFRDLEDEMNQLLGGFGPATAVSPAARRDQGLSQLASGALGAVDVRETNNHYEFKVDVPGMDADDLKINVSPDRVLTIQGERTREDAEPDAAGGYQRYERVHGTFVRRFQLPDNVSVDDIDAKTENGVLRLNVPKMEEEKPQHKEIKVSKA